MVVCACPCSTRRKDNKQVAIKIIDLEESKDDVQTICREITTLVSSSCPQLINYYGSAVFGTKLWIAMEVSDAKQTQREEHAERGSDDAMGSDSSAPAVRSAVFVCA